MRPIRYASSFGRLFAASVVVALITVGVNVITNAATPEQISLGQRLFTQEFAATPLTENGDGLGPLFNHTSCAACHHAGGIGGAGDHRFNARTFTISSLNFDPSKTKSSFVETMKVVAPGFVAPTGSMVNSFAMHRRGGSPGFDAVRQKAMSTFNPHWNDDAKVRSDDIHAEATANRITDSYGALSITGHLHSRNTTALFGAGLIDLVPDSVLLQQVKAQQRHPEIHGRPATLADGRIGKFGWRANFATLLEFTENACVNELGLQSKRVPQAKDITQTRYLNTQTDIHDDSIKAMAAFIAGLPAPSRVSASDWQHQNEINTGVQRFVAIGCAVCHAPTLGPAIGVYSDLLLHDMGVASTDYNSAPPYRKNLIVQYENIGVETTALPYYGGNATITPPPVFTSNNTNSRVFHFEAPQRPPRTVREPVKFGNDDILVEKDGTPGLLNGRPIEVRRVLQRTSIAETNPTQFNQEWRTAPLWGLRDSAPYMHDGRAETVLEAIAMHGGESEKTRNRFFSLTYEDQQAVLAFLDTLVAPQSGVVPSPKDFSRRHVAME